jgi:hypothetical protein
MSRPGPGLLDPAAVTGAVWALWAIRRTQRGLRRRPVTEAAPAIPRLPQGAGRGVHAVLRRREPSCLVRALVLQAWLRAAGERRDVIIGVTSAREDFRAHAWLEGERGPGFVELRRVAP